MNLSVSKYLCPFCGEWHKQGDPEYIAHFPTEQEQDILLKETSHV
jgi:hypothetical protein